TRVHQAAQIVYSLLQTQEGMLATLQEIHLLAAHTTMTFLELLLHREGEDHTTTYSRTALRITLSRPSAEERWRIAICISSSGSCTSNSLSLRTKFKSATNRSRSWNY